ncbi:cytochrome P450 [Humitalea rosea]|uniref:Cytochrome P450 n=1 Tax=Humitalea rosea TaxID=990373 RepID=A0A2W7IU44_9PROT|nr:cytochrome P450 [Humitalea rosea]PZW51034.1 cytochrome P450 [Humitalea rosea]
MTDAPFLTPYPPRSKTRLPIHVLLREGRKSFLNMFPESAFRSPFLRQRVLLRDVFITNSPETVQEAFITKAAVIERKSPQQRHALIPLLGDGLFVSDGATWRERRRAVAPVTHVSRLAELTPPITETVAERAEAWAGRPEGAPIDALEEMAQLTAEIICRTIFGGRLGAAAAHTVVEAFSDYQAAVGQMDILSMLALPEWLPRPQSARVRRAAGRIHGVVDGLIAEARGRREASLIRSLAEGSGAALTPDALRNEASVLFMAGHETTANTLAWAWFLLSQSPAEEAAVQAEADAVLGGRPAGFADFPKLIRARAVVEETLRLYPPVPLLARQATRETELAGRRVRKGSLVMAVPWLLHRHQNLWDRPDHFIPDRFMPGAPPPPRHGYIPFAVGPRVCTGMAFGLTEAVLCLATLAGRFRLRLEPGAQVMPVCRLTLRPGDRLPMRLHHRHG